MTSCSDERILHPSSTFKRPYGLRFVQKAGAGTGVTCHPAQGPDGRQRSRNRFCRRRFGQGNPRASGTRTQLHDPPARARGQFGRRWRRGDGCDAFHHPPAHQCLDRPHQRRTGHRDDVFARRRQVHPVGTGDRLPGARRRQARRSGQRGRARSQRQCGSPEGVVSGDRQCRQPDRADRAADHAAGAQFHHRGRARRRGRARLRRSRHRGEGARGADPERD